LAALLACSTQILFAGLRQDLNASRLALRFASARIEFVLAYSVVSGDPRTSCVCAFNVIAIPMAMTSVFNIFIKVDTDT
jgi:hypothetical protein